MHVDDIELAPTTFAKSFRKDIKEKLVAITTSTTATTTTSTSTTGWVVSHGGPFGVHGVRRGPRDG